MHSVKGWWRDSLLPLLHHQHLFVAALWGPGILSCMKDPIAACAWKTSSRWIGRRYHLGINKEAFDAEVYAIYQALSIMDYMQESGYRYTVFVDSASATERIWSDSIDPGLRFAAAAIEVCTRLVSRANEVTIRWVPAHQCVLGNEKADELAKAAAEGGRPDSSVPDEYRWVTSLPHMMRVASEARSGSAAQWIRDHVGPQRKYIPPIVIIIIIVHLRMQTEGYGAAIYIFWAPGPYRIFVSPVSSLAVLRGPPLLSLDFCLHSAL